MRYWPFVAIAVGEIALAVAIFLAGAFYAETHRYDDCVPWTPARELIYVCRAGELPPSPAEDGEPL
jgi:hypothetical protein